MYTTWHNIDTSAPSGRINFDEELDKRKLIKNNLSTKFTRLIGKIAKFNLITLVFTSIVISLGISYLAACPSFLNRCHEVFIETRQQLVPIGLEKGSPNPKERRTKIKREIIASEWIDGNVFRSLLLLSAFILAFLRWQYGNRQSSMSEIFERKKSSNLDLIAHEGAVQDLVSGAVDPPSPNLQMRQTIFSKEQVDTLCNDFASRNPYGNKEATFKQKMFVFMELDNLEFAYTKFKSGMLDNEQIYRACEIFESRCQSELFRHLAAKQGLAYYTEDFHEVVRILLIFGYARSHGNVDNLHNDSEKTEGV